MASDNVSYYCNVCDRKICDESDVCRVKYRYLFASGISDCVQKTYQGKRCALVCSCGEYVGEYIAARKKMNYCLDLEKVKSCSVRSNGHSDAEGACSQQETFPLQSQLDASTLSREVDHANNKPHTNSTVCVEEASEEDEIVQLKKTVAALEEQVKSLQNDTVGKFKDMCGMLLSQKLEIQRLQEIIWALHPNFNLDPAFSVNNYVAPSASGSGKSFCYLDVEED